MSKNYEDRINEMIDKELDGVEIPDSLKPQNMVDKLKYEKIKRRNRTLATISSGVAACAVVVCGFGVMKMLNNRPIVTKQEVNTSTQIEAEEFVAAEKTRQLGDSYAIADSYEDVLKAVDLEMKETVDYGWSLGGGRKDYIVEDVVYEESGVASDGAMSANKEDAAGSHSATNMMEQGVDEADYVITDGKKIYYLYSDVIYIVDAKNMKTLATLDDWGNQDTVKEFYVDKSKMYVVTSNYKETFLYTFSLKDISRPRLITTYKQDGAYNTSRKVGDYVYLFSYHSEYYEDDAFWMNNFVNQLELIPKVCGKRVDCDRIYIPERGDTFLVASSVDLRHPHRPADTMAVLTQGANIYMGQESLYLYENDYCDGYGYEKITRFSYKNGQLNGEASARVEGDIRDSFAISEGDGYLRVLTTSYTGETDNILHMLDMNLNEVGTLDDIARGESIYAARFIGDKAYFITYLNKDPLFIADISDAANPKLLGNVEITGFSDYLHQWDENNLLGIGYETDEDTSQVLGVKLTMFDVSDSSNPTIKATEVLTEYTDVPGCAYYKTILVDPEKNLIGFEVESYEYEIERAYVLYQWNGEAFEQIWSTQIEGFDYYDYYYSNPVTSRGLYIDDTFYFVCGEQMSAYDMTNAFATKGSIDLLNQ